MALILSFIKFLIVKGAEYRSQPTERPYECDLHANEINHEAEAYLLRKREALLGFTLHLNQRISRRKKIRVHVVTAVRRKTEIAGLVRGLERPAHQVTAGPDMFRPWHDEISETHIGACLEPIQTGFFDQFIAEPTESKSSLVVAEVRTSYHAKPYVGGARTVAVAMLEAEVNCPADGQRSKVRIRKQCRRQDLGQYIQSRDGRRVAHQGQLNELLDRAAPEL